MFRKRKPRKWNPLTGYLYQKSPYNVNRYNNPSIYKDNAILVKRVLREGVDPNFIRERDNKYELPALSYAIFNNYSEVIGILKVFMNDDRTDVNKSGLGGYTPIIFVCRGDVSDEVGVKLISLLLKHSKIQINKKTNADGGTALHFACANGKSKCVKALIDDDRTNINITDNYGITALYLAVRYGHLEVVKILLSSSSIDPNILSHGLTPLHRAHRERSKEIMKEILKDNRTDPNIPDKDGKIIAEMITDPELLEYIEGPQCHKDIFCI